MASAVIMMVGGAILNATAFTGSMYLAKSLTSSSHTDEEKIRHDKAIEKYQHDMGEWQKKREEYQDWLTTQYANKKIAQENLQNTDYAFKLYASTHPTFNKPHFKNYYTPSKMQKRNEMLYVGGGMLTIGYVASKFL